MTLLQKNPTMELVDVSNSHRDEILKKIVKDLVMAMENNSVTEADLPLIANFVLNNIDTDQNHDQLIAHLDELSKRWPFFEKVEQLERGEVKEANEDRVEKNVLIMVKAGQTEQAISLAKSVMKV
ncbi:MAG: hypothetical protein Q8P25_04415 [Candidatus Curtissbacteria bacterium]|nr:hypothetical protein [Candidatus Curtissbacteria bacterium]